MYKTVKIFFSVSGRGNECSPGNSGLDVFSFILHIQLLFLGEFLSVNKKDHSLKAKVDIWLK